MTTTNASLALASLRTLADLPATVTIRRDNVTVSINGQVVSVMSAGSTVDDLAAAIVAAGKAIGPATVRRPV